VAFINNSVGTIDSVVWEFGDGNESVLTSPIHTYEDPGTYSVELTVYGVVNSDSLVHDEYVAVYDERPLISAIEDVPNDQGGQVFLSWNPSGWDGPVGTTITQYSMWEEYIDQWINISTAMATQADSYLFLANTFGDSSASGTNWAKFKIIAHTADPAVFYESPVDSGYSLDNTPELGINKGNVLPTEFALHENYPNPFNPDTRIRYDLPEESLVRIMIYDMLGRKIKTLVERNETPGHKSVVWDGSNDYGKQVSAGVYLFHIESSGFKQTKKMILLK
jgi:PKD repeat protein